jgi:hypothetical protein
MFDKNKVYALLFSKGLQQYYKHITDYITFDFETVEQKIYYTPQSSTKILAWILPHTVAASIDKKTTIYYDTRNGEDFVHQFIKELFRQAKIIAEGQKYENIPGVDQKFINRLNYFAKMNDIPILGFNSAKFDMNLFLKYLNCDEWSIDSSACICTSTNMKMIRVKEKIEKSPDDKTYVPAISLVFKDAINYISPSPLANFVKDFGGISDEKAPFPYEGYDVESADEYFSSTNMFPRSAFHDTLNNTTVKQEDEKYRQCFLYWIKMKYSGKVKTRWDYLKFYNENDCEIMRPAIDNLIRNMWEDKIDMLKGFSLAQNASSVKFAMAWSDFRMDGNYA